MTTLLFEDTRSKNASAALQRTARLIRRARQSRDLFCWYL